MNPLVEIIAQEVAATGVLSFCRFMELVLYCPEYGFYERERDNVGRRGDFFTSVSVGPLFGQMLAFQFAEWFREFQVSSFKFQIVEAGAHDGKLAGDILNWLREKRPKLFESLEYCIIERSKRRQQWQAETLAGFGDRVRWTEEISKLNNGQSSIGSRQFTVVFSNELLDAFPVHRLGWDAKAKSWFEWGVTVKDGRFVWERCPQVSSFKFQVSSLPEELLAVLPDGFMTEVCAAAEGWWRTAAEKLERGKLLTFDYGLTTEEFFHPQRHQGTLRSYHRHRVSEDVLANPGEQDITAHVNFSTLLSAGADAGLKTDAFMTQAKFLAQIAEKIWQPQSNFGEWTSAHSRQFQTLTHPEHLGRPFHALVQSR